MHFSAGASGFSGLGRGGRSKAKMGGSGRHPEPPLGKDLEFHYVLRLIAFRPFGNIEFHVIAFIQRLETTGLYSGMVHENIIPGIATDKSVAFFIVKPLYNALFFAHFSSSKITFYFHPRVPRGNALKMSVIVPFDTQGDSKPNVETPPPPDDQDPSHFRLMPNIGRKRIYIHVE